MPLRCRHVSHNRYLTTEDYTKAVLGTSHMLRALAPRIDLLTMS